MLDCHPFSTHTKFSKKLTFLAPRYTALQFPTLVYVACICELISLFQVNYYGLSIEGCKACSCNEFGSQILQCSSLGKCQCLTAADGEKCDKCRLGFYGLPVTPCKGMFNVQCVLFRFGNFRYILPSIKKQNCRSNETALLLSNDIYFPKKISLFQRLYCLNIHK